MKDINDDINDDIISYWESKDGEHKSLENIDSQESLDWIYKQNQHTLSILGNPQENQNNNLYSRILSVLDSKEKIPYITKYGNYYYNLWKDEKNPRGIYRRTTLESYLLPDNLTSWETVIDLDLLGKDEGESWVWKGCFVYANYTMIEPSRALIQLSRGGSDAFVIREFNLITKSFLNDNEKPFNVGEAKSMVSWLDEDTVLIGTNLHDGNSLTDSGYPKNVRLWKRGTNISDSPIIFEGQSSDVYINASHQYHGSYSITIISRNITFYTSEKFIRLESGFNSDSHSIEFKKLTSLPSDAIISQFQDSFLIKLRSDFMVNSKTYESGSLLSIRIIDLMNEILDNIQVIFQPASRCSLGEFYETKNNLILSVLDNVKERLVFYRYESSIVSWVLIEEEHQAVIRMSSIKPLDSDHSDEYWLTMGSMINVSLLYDFKLLLIFVNQPDTLKLVNSNDAVKGVHEARIIRSLPHMFNNENLQEQQLEAISSDGTRIPYFIISNKDIQYDGNNSTLLYGYGGFEISLTPTYAPVVGLGWLERGGVFVSANIRGGGEFGPSWHQAAKRENRYLAYDDFIAVAEDLIHRNITTPSKLGIRGGSNGGLLMGNMIIRRPDLFGAVVCAVPLLDMRRYNVLLAGASWMAEYGNPDTMDWNFLRKYSAYHNINFEDVKCDKYPPLLMTTSTRDDRVHPYHARCFAKRLLDIRPYPMQSDNSTCPIQRDRVFYYENIEGGHGGAADNPQQAFMNALYLDFLWKVIG